MTFPDLAVVSTFRSVADVRMAQGILMRAGLSRWSGRTTRVATPVQRVIRLLNEPLPAARARGVRKMLSGQDVARLLELRRVTAGVTFLPPSSI
jgi:hypothetical protein